MMMIRKMQNIIIVIVCQQRAMRYSGQNVNIIWERESCIVCRMIIIILWIGWKECGLHIALPVMIPSVSFGVHHNWKGKK